MPRGIGLFRPTRLRSHCSALDFSSVLSSPPCRGINAQHTQLAGGLPHFLQGLFEMLLISRFHVDVKLIFERLSVDRAAFDLQHIHALTLEKCPPGQPPPRPCAPSPPQSTFFAQRRPLGNERRRSAVAATRNG